MTIHIQLPVLGLEGQLEPEAALARLNALRRVLVELSADGMVLAFSGGVDSGFLLWAAVSAGVDRARLIAVTAIPPSIPANDLADARRIASRLGVEHRLVSTSEMEDPRYRRNDAARCYYCKLELFRMMKTLALEWQFEHLVYGFNRSDRSDVRPGHQAATEESVRAPLDEVGLTKIEIRWLLQRTGLELADKPSSPCLASRIEQGLEVTAERLATVAAMEEILRRTGVMQHRVRIASSSQGAFLRIESAPEDMELVLQARDALNAEGTARGYRWVVLDLGGYRMGGASR